MLRRRKQGNEDDTKPDEKDRDRKGSEKNQDKSSKDQGNHGTQELKNGDLKKDGPLKEGKAGTGKVVVRPPQKPRWRCLDTCCWLIGYMCVLWWLFLVLYNALPSLPQYVTEAITGPLPELPGSKLAREGLHMKHPVVFVPGIVTGGLELWEGQPCAEGLFRKRLWGGTFGEVYKRPLCWLEHMRLDNETGLDPEGIRVRPVSGLVAADYFAPGYFVWAVLIENLARIGYEERSMYMAAYDWRLAFQNTEIRDKSLSRLKSTIELLVKTNNDEKVVAIPHSMGALYFLHFLKWVEVPAPLGGGGGKDWVAKHVKAVMNIGGPFLGVPKAFAGLFSAEAKDIAVARAVAPGVLDSELFGLQTLQHIMAVTRTWDATMSMLPRGGETIWGDLDSSPEEGFECGGIKKQQKIEQEGAQECKISDGKELGPHGKPKAHYGRMVSFGKDALQAPSSTLKRKINFTEVEKRTPLRENVSCGDTWTEYHEMSWESVEAVASGKVYTADGILDVLRFVAPKMMKRADSNWGYGIADDLSDPKYEHFKYWSSPLEMTLPNAPDMDIYCMYGRGILTERSYIYKLSSNADTCHIPFRIDASVEKDSEGCLKGGVHFVDGDETIPVLSAGYMCARPWKGKTRFNPAGVSSYVREFQHEPPANLLQGRGTQSGSHVDIMGNMALIEDVLRVAAGASGEQLGGDRIFSDLLKWADRIKLRL